MHDKIVQNTNSQQAQKRQQPKQHWVTCPFSLGLHHATSSTKQAWCTSCPHAHLRV